MSSQPYKDNGEDPEKVLRGVVQRVTFRNDQNGYAVVRVEVSDQTDPITVVGTFPTALQGLHVVLRGRYIDHPKFGKQFSASSVTETAPSSPDGLKRFLSSGHIKGVGAQTAERLVDAFGEQAIDVILKDPDRAAKVKGIGAHKIALLREKLLKDEGSREALRFLMEHQIPRGVAEKVMKAYGAAAVERVSKDPYVLARDIRGIGFATADTIALNLGLKPDSPQRLRAGLYHALEKASEDGHCYLTRKGLFDQAAVVLGLADSVDLSPFLEELTREDYVVVQEERVALRHIYRAEQFVAGFIASRCKDRDAPIISESGINAALSEAEAEQKLTLSQEQRDAVFLAAKSPLAVITGGPGCGKTTVIRALSVLFRKAGKRLVLAAPTGRAAQRMSQVCDLPASTIHRLLKYDPSTGGFLYGANQQLETDAIIIDECSMVDITLARDLFAAIPAHATLILVGDRDQLPSVGPGRLLGDLVSLKEVPLICLSRLYRRAEESNITSIAHAINAGLVPQIPEPDGVVKSDSYFLSRSDADEAATTIEKLVSDQLPRKFGFAPEEITVLTPTNRGPLGAVTLNERLQRVLNPSGSRDIEQEISLPWGALRVGDRVCQRVNNYQLHDLGVFNGDLGTVYSINQQSRKLVVELWDGRLITYDFGELSQLSLAYAITVHRAQGSEMPCVVLALHDSQYALLERQLVYTAVTRAKKLLIVVGSKRALSIAARRTNTQRRLTHLATEIKARLAADESR